MPLPTITKSTVTITIAAPGVVGWTAHGLTAGTPIVFTTTGALPTGLVVDGSASSIFYVSSAGLAANTFQVSTSYVNAISGTSLTTSGSQSGTHTCAVNTGFYSPFDITDVAVTFPTSGSYITWTNHRLTPGSLVSFSATTMPSGVIANKEYWVAEIIDPNTIILSVAKFPIALAGYIARTYTTAGVAVKGRILQRKQFTLNPLQIYTVPLAAHVNLAFTNIIPGSLIYVVARAGGDVYHPAGTRLINPTTVAGTSYSHPLTLYADQPFTCVITNSAGGYEPILFDDICTTANGFSRLVQQRLDS
jgi:hypothetical protein